MVIATIAIVFLALWPAYKVTLDFPAWRTIAVWCWAVWCMLVVAAFAFGPRLFMEKVTFRVAKTLPSTVIGALSGPTIGPFTAGGVAFMETFGENVKQAESAHENSPVLTGVAQSIFEPDISDSLGQFVGAMTFLPPFGYWWGRRRAKSAATRTGSGAHPMSPPTQD